MKKVPAINRRHFFHSIINIPSENQAGYEPSIFCCFLSILFEEFLLHITRNKLVGCELHGK